MKTTEELIALLASWPGIAILVAALVQVSKNIKWIDDNREPELAVVLGAILAVIAKASGLMVIGAGWSGWVIAIVGGILVGGGAGIVHDYAATPVSGMVKKALGLFFNFDLGGNNIDAQKPPEDPKP